MQHLQSEGCRCTIQPTKVHKSNKNIASSDSCRWHFSDVERSLKMEGGDAVDDSRVFFSSSVAVQGLSYVFVLFYCSYSYNRSRDDDEATAHPRPCYHAITTALAQHVLDALSTTDTHLCRIQKSSVFTVCPATRYFPHPYNPHIA